MEVKITKAEAKKLYDSGKTVILTPSKSKLYGNWPMWAPFNKKELKKRGYGEGTFEELVKSFKYYNCSEKNGKTVIFYKPSKSFRM